MTDSNKKPASATPGKPAGRTSDGTSAGTRSEGATAPERAPGTTRSGPKGLKVSAAVAAAKAAKAAKASKSAKSGGKSGRKSGAKASGRPGGKGPFATSGKAGATLGAKAGGPGQQAAAPKRRDAPVAAAVPEITDTVTPAKRALAWTHTARFLTTASQLHHLPQNGVLPGQEPALDDELQAAVAAEDATWDDTEAADALADDGLADDDIDGEGDSREASEPETLPPRPLPEIAFVGRSNAGKSTAINTLAQQKRLAFASKTPGRTQHINLFVLGPKDAPDALFADLPGYGYAAVARDAKLRWQRVMADYLSQRETLSGVVLMVDSRHGLTDLDKQLLEFVSDRVTAGEVSLLVLLTKADKLNRKEGAAALAQVQKELAVLATEDSDIAVSLFSALNKQGLDDAAELIYEWAHREPRVLSSDEDDDVWTGDEDADAADADADAADQPDAADDADAAGKR